MIPSPDDVEPPPTLQLPSLLSVLRLLAVEVVSPPVVREQAAAHQ